MAGKSESISATEKFRKNKGIITGSKSSKVKDIDINNYISKTKQAKTKVIYGKKSLHPIEEFKKKNKYKNLAEARSQRDYFNEYKRKDLIPYFRPYDTVLLVDPAKFDPKNTKLRKVNIIYEKDKLISKSVLSDPKIKAVSSYGNSTQTQSFHGDPRWLGFYTQISTYKKANIGKTSSIYEFPNLAQADKVVVDNDGIGQLNAYIQNMYGWNNPYKKNVHLGGLDKPATSVDHIIVQQELAKSVLNTLATRNSKAYADAIKRDIGSVLKYRDDSGKTVDLTISGQLVNITNKVHQDMINTKLEVSIPDKQKPLLFDYELLDFNEKKPTLEFFEYQEDQVRQLDTDQLLRASVKKFSIEPDTAQRILENLHNQGIVTYPRVKASDKAGVNEPIKISDWNKYESFQGTAIEENMLRLIVEANKSNTKDVKENFIKFGYWELKSGDKSWRTEDTLFSGDTTKYDESAFDIRISKNRGITPEDLTNYLVKVKIGTPATRTQELARLKNAGIINLRNDRYVLDSRGLYLASAGKLPQKIKIGNDLVFMGDILKYSHNKVENTKNIDELATIINQFPMFDRITFSELISVKAKELIKQEHDLAYLESF